MAEEFKEASYVDRLSIDLTDEQETRLYNWIENRKQIVRDDREQFLERQKKYLFNFDDFITYNRKGPWDGSSNIHLPLTSIVLKSYHSRLYNIFTQEDTTSIVPREPMDASRVEITKRLRDWYLWDYINGYKGIKGVANELFYDTCSVGFGIVMKNWELKQRKSIKIERRELEKEMADLQGIAEENIKNNKKIDIKPYKEVQRVITVFEGTRLVTVPFENAYFPNEIPESSDLNYPELVIITSEMSISDLKLKAEQGLWSREDADKVVQTRGRATETDEHNIKEIRDRLSGYDTEHSFYKNDKRDIEYCFCSYDIDDDGVAEEIIVTRSPDTKKILKTTYLDRVSPSGRRPLFKFDCFTKSRQSYSRGVPEFCFPLQEELDLNHNLRMDYLQLQTCPFGFYRGGSSLDNQPIRIAPGKFIPVDEVTDVRPFTFSSNAQLFASEEDRLWQYATWLTSVSPLSQGAVPNTVGPTRSTSGVVTLLQQMDKQFKPVVDQIAESWKALEFSILEDLDFRVDPQIKMRVLGPAIQEQLKDITPEQIMELNQSLLLTKNFDIKIDVASIINSDEVRRNEATLILQTLSNPSLLQQTGIVGPKALYKAIQDYLKAYGRKPDQFIDEPEMTTKPLTLWQEIQIIGQGEMPPMSMRDDHPAKAQMLSAFMQTPEWAQAKDKGLYVGDVDMIMQKAIDKHMTLAQALEPKGQPNQVGEQGQDMSALMTGTAVQQGGPNVENTTSRDLAEGGGPEQDVPPEGLETGGGAGGAP